MEKIQMNPAAVDPSGLLGTELGLNPLEAFNLLVWEMIDCTAEG
jgi:hypothetical protein